MFTQHKEKFMKEFDLIIGYDSIKAELKRTCDVLKNFDKYQACVS